MWPPVPYFRFISTWLAPATPDLRFEPTRGTLCRVGSERGAAVRLFGLLLDSKPLLPTLAFCCSARNYTLPRWPSSQSRPSSSGWVMRTCLSLAVPPNISTPSSLPSSLHRHVAELLARGHV